MVIVNVFDNLFQDGCSVAYQMPQHIQYVRRQQRHDGVTFFVDAWMGEGEKVDAVDCPYKIGWLREPYCLHPTTYEHAWRNRFRFDKVLTYYQPFLRFGEPFEFVPYGGVWIPQEKWGIQPKTKLCSFLVGEKMGAQGHRIRREAAEMLRGHVDLFDSQQDKTIPYGPMTKIATLRDYAFSVITETCREDNLFTEWMLDAFSQGTIPILWACPNLKDFFNERGVLSWSTLEELSEIMAHLSFDLYHDLLPAAKDNFSHIDEYTVTEDWIWKNVLQKGEYGDSPVSA